MRTSFLVILLVVSNLVSAQIKDIGFSFITNYTKENYQGGAQNWSIDQDSRGIMYFANNGGLLSFDGTNWRIYPMPNYSIIRSIFIDDRDIIYVGAFNEIGYFTPDEMGELTYHSLIDRIPVEYHDFGSVWNIMPYKDGIIFHSFNIVFYISESEVRIISDSRNLHFSFAVEGSYYVMEYPKGILTLNDLELQWVKYSDFFQHISVSKILPFSKDVLLVVSREKGLFLLDNNGVRIFKTPLQSYFQSYQIYSATKFGNDHYVFGTVQNGVIIMNSKGELVQHLNRSRGMQNHTVLSVFVDKSSNLWLGLDNGIDYVMLNSPFSVLAHESGIGAVYAIEEYNSDLYFGTNQGLYRTAWPGEAQIATENPELEFVPGSQGQVWALRTINNVLMVGHDVGTYMLDGNKLVNLSTFPGEWNFIDVPGSESILLSGSYEGLLVFELNNTPGRKGYSLKTRLKGFSESCKQMQFDTEGYLWIGHGYRGIYRLKLTDTHDSVTEARHYTRHSGLPANHLLNILDFGEEVLIGTNEGIYKYNRSEDRFERDPELSLFFGNQNVHLTQRDKNGNIWFFADNNLGILKPNFDGTYSKTTVPFLPLRNKMLGSYESVFLIDWQGILFPTLEGVLHFDPGFKKEYNTPFNVLVRSVKFQNDTLTYGSSSYSASGSVPVLDFRNNSIQFIFSAVYFEFPGHTEYTYMLEGFDQTWSDWSHSNEKEYTYLHEGEYSFHVKARNVYGFESNAQQFSFVVLPPWYRSKIAYLTYTLLFILAIIASIQYVIKRIEKEKQHLKEKQKKVIQEKDRVFAEESLKAEQEIIRLRNEKLEIENQRSKSELENRTKELASIAMQITYKNELLAQIKHKLIKVAGKMIHRESKHQVDALIKTLEKDIISQDDWDRFEVHFDQVHEDFMKKLRNNYTELTPKDLRLCAYLRMNLSSKEIAPLLNISIRGVEISRYRLRKKLDLDRDANLTDFMMHL
jgi:DNA-binding CsgD family transcriptional regulator